MKGTLGRVCLDFICPIVIPVLHSLVIFSYKDFDSEHNADKH